MRVRSKSFLRSEYQVRVTQLGQPSSAMHEAAEKTGSAGDYDFVGVIDTLIQLP